MAPARNIEMVEDNHGRTCMKQDRRVVRRLTVFAAAVLVLATNETTPVAQVDEAPVRMVIEQFANAWNRGDAENAAATFTTTGVLIAGDGSQTRGRHEIQQYLTQLLGTLSKGTKFVAPVTGVRFLTADVALAQSEGGFLLPGETAVAPERHGVHSMVAVRDGATWRVALAQRTRIQAYGKPK
jgi:uncharacterized protein (TIGR02246 family)